MEQLRWWATTQWKCCCWQPVDSYDLQHRQRSWLLTSKRRDQTVTPPLAPSVPILEFLGYPPSALWLPSIWPNDSFTLSEDSRFSTEITLTYLLCELLVWKQQGRGVNAHGYHFERVEKVSCALLTPLQSILTWGTFVDKKAWKKKPLNQLIPYLPPCL